MTLTLCYICADVYRDPYTLKVIKDTHKSKCEECKRKSYVVTYEADEKRKG